MACPYAEAGHGPRWGEIEIGVSTLEEFYAAYSAYEIEVDFNEDENSAYIVMHNEQSWPFDYRMCLVDGVIVSVEGRPPPMSPQPPVEVTPDLSFRPTSMEYYVRQLGIPNAVTYTFSPSHRIAFWFEDGLAVVVWIAREEEITLMGGFGTVERVIFFPFQEAEGYETRWPYNRTYPEWIYNSDDRIPSEQNPFDFEAMIATITAEPSRTPTPTSTPRPTESAATPAP